MSGVRKQVYISASLDRTLKRIGDVEHVSESEVIRRALELYFRERGVEEEQDPISLTIGLAGDQGSGTGSRQHDDIYDEVT